MRPKDGSLLCIAHGTDCNGKRRRVSVHAAGQGFKLHYDTGHSMVGHPNSQSEDAIRREIAIVYELDNIVFDYPQLGIIREPQP